MPGSTFTTRLSNHDRESHTMGRPISMPIIVPLVSLRDAPRNGRVAGCRAKVQWVTVKSSSAWVRLSQSILLCMVVKFDLTLVVIRVPVKGKANPLRL